MNIILSGMSEDTKRIIIVLLLVFILAFVIIGSLSILIKKIMTFQANKMEDMVHDVVVTGVIKDSKKLINYGIRKNHRYFFKKSWIPFVIMATGGLALLLYCIINQNWSVNPFEWEKGVGFGTLFFQFDWENAPRATFFGMTLISDWPEVIHTPTWSWNAWGSYLFVPCIFIGGIWFLVDIQAYIARSFRLFKLSKKVFNKTLENFNADTLPRDPVKPE